MESHWRGDASRPAEAPHRARAFDHSERPTRTLKEMRESPHPSAASESPWSNAPIVATLAHVFHDARHRLFGSGITVAAEPEPWVMHAENPNAEPHPAKDRGACGLCISYVGMGRTPIAVQMVQPCPSCGGGGRHERDCAMVLADHAVYEGAWQDLPGQLRFDQWAEDNRRRGYLP